MYKWIKARIDVEGELTWEYQVIGFNLAGSMVHDEDVSMYSDSQIAELTMDNLDVPDSQKGIIQVLWD